MPCNRPRKNTYLSWLKARAAKVEATVPSVPVIVHQGFWIRSPMKMRSPLRGLLTNITWAAPRRTQSMNCRTRGLSARDRQSHQQGIASAFDHWLAQKLRCTGMPQPGHFSFFNLAWGGRMKGLGVGVGT